MAKSKQLGSKSIQSKPKPKKSVESLNKKVKDLNDNEPVQKVPSARSKLPKEDRKLYSISGEISVQIVNRPPLVARAEGFESKTLVVDKLGNAFDRGVIQLDVNDESSLALLDAKQVEILMKVLRVAPNNVKEQQQQIKEVN